MKNFFYPNDGLAELIEVIEASCSNGDAHNHTYLPEIMQGILYGTGNLKRKDEQWNSYSELSKPLE